MRSRWHKNTSIFVKPEFLDFKPGRAIHNVISNCYRCWCVKSIPFESAMSNLPVSRILRVKPFSIVDVDYGGPYLITIEKMRCQNSYIYIIIFVFLFVLLQKLHTSN